MITFWMHYPVRNDLQHTRIIISRRAFKEAPRLGAVRCAPSRQVDAVCFTCGADPCECIAVKGVHRTWTRLPAR